MQDLESNEWIAYKLIAAFWCYGESFTCGRETSDADIRFWDFIFLVATRSADSVSGENNLVTFHLWGKKTMLISKKKHKRNLRRVVGLYNS